ncbi:DUF167 domain-containing protein [Candidatus Micrarchaeota archaeon]|nr:DUF167 domain-containing protein [Candidatus Micrarchaeota archaeon]
MGKLKARITPNAREFRAEFDEETRECRVWVPEKPEKNKANKQLVKNLEKLFGCSVTITRGANSRNKILETSKTEQEVIAILKSQSDSFEERPRKRENSTLIRTNTRPTRTMLRSCGPQV